MSNTHEADSDERKVVTFTLDNQMFGIDMTALIEIREWEEPTPLPGVPSFIKGVINLRGSVVPVVGLAERLGWTPSALHARSCVLVVSIDDKQCGFLIDQLADIVVIDTKEIQPAPAMDLADENVISGLARIERRAMEKDEETEAMVLLLDIEALSLTRHLVDLAA